MRSEASELLHEAFIQLPERDRQVAMMLDVHNLTLREIGEHFGVSESRVCQIHAGLLGKLRRILGPSEDLFAAISR